MDDRLELPPCTQCALFFVFNFVFFSSRFEVRERRALAVWPGGHLCARRWAARERGTQRQLGRQLGRRSGIHLTLHSCGGGRRQLNYIGAQLSSRAQDSNKWPPTCKQTASETRKQTVFAGTGPLTRRPLKCRLVCLANKQVASAASGSRGMRDTCAVRLFSARVHWPSSKASEPI